MKSASKTARRNASESGTVAMGRRTDRREGKEMEGEIQEDERRSKGNCFRVVAFVEDFKVDIQYEFHFFCFTFRSEGEISVNATGRVEINSCVIFIFIFNVIFQTGLRPT